MKSVGFIGLGTMGKPMAANLLKKGYPLTVYNRTQEKAQELVSLGAEIVNSPAEAARSVDVLFTMLSNDAAAAEIYYGANGIVEAVRPGTAVFDCSTVSPELSVRLNRDLARRHTAYLDAPVSGSQPAAVSADLAFIVGGDREVFDAHEELLRCMGKHAYYVGPSGNGSKTKLAVNTTLALNMLALCEGLTMAAKSDLDLELFLDIVKSGGASSKLTEIKGDKMIKRDFASQFSLDLMVKDLNLASAFSQQMRLPLPSLAAARTIFQTASNLGFGQEDMSAVIQNYTEWSSIPIGKSAQPNAVETAAASGESAAAEAGDQEERRRSERVPMGIDLQLSVYQWEKEGAFSGQDIQGILYDMSDSGLQITSGYPLAMDMFVVIHFPKEADLPPITGKIIRIDVEPDLYRYGCLLSGLSPYTRMKLESYLQHKKLDLQAST